MDKKERKHLQASILYPFLFISILWFIKIFEYKNEYQFYHYGVYPLTFSGLKGLLFSPFIHSSFSHLLSNTSPIFILLAGLIYLYKNISLVVFTSIYFLSNIGVWLFARPSYHIGASGIVYGLFFFIFFSGVFRKDRRSIALALLAVFLYGGSIWGLVPIDESISHEAHTFGSIVGFLLSILFRKVPIFTLEEPPKEELVPEWEEDIWGQTIEDNDEDNYN